MHTLRSASGSLGSCLPGSLSPELARRVQQGKCVLGARARRRRLQRLRTTRLMSNPVCVGRAQAQPSASCQIHDMRTFDMCFAFGPCAMR